MATKKFMLEVEEGVTECNESCPFDEYGELCNKHNWNSCHEFNCDCYNFATIRIKELEGTKCSET